MNGKTRSLLIGLPLLLAACGVAAPPTQPPTQAPPTSAPPTGAPDTPAPTDPAGNDPAALNGRHFLSVKVTDNGAPYPLVPGTTISLRFTDGTLSAQAGCNTMSGSYAIDGDGRLIANGGWATTEMGCDPARHAQDEWLSTLLSSQPVVVIDGDKVVITSGSTVIELLDREVAQPDVQLTTQIWNLSSIISGDAVSSVPMGVAATILFNDDGTVSFNSGCNSGGGGYAVDGQTISFTNLVMTEMACPGPRSDVEAAFLAVLSADAVDFVIDADQLTLLAGDNGLQFTAG
jgi:heat shock protein HslJ